VFPLSVEQYHAMIGAGVLTDDDPVELLEGVLIFKTPKKPKHRIALAKLARVLQPSIPPQFSIQLQEPITLADGEPEPDLSVIRGVPEDYPDRHPGPKDVPLVIEVADATLRRDRGIKLRSYARAGLPIYWIVDAVGRKVEVYTRPEPRAKPPRYAAPRVYSEDEKLPVEVNGKRCGLIRVSSILP
jgi:Uma2 family endonuclease